MVAPLKFMAGRRSALAELAVLAAVDLALAAAVIRFRGYTEIDWQAYMEQIAIIASGERDYAAVEGGTGPLVYPGGFVLAFGMLWRMTGRGQDIALAQWLFAGLHVVVVLVVARIHQVASGPMVRRWTTALLLVSPRIMSLFVLRLFNDTVETLLVYLSILLFATDRWSAGCLVYSLGVSVKMNALLLAPGLLLLLTQKFGHHGAWMRILGICAPVQLVMGAPFLLHNPVSYLTRAFELSRVFFYKWSVNFAFLPEAVFLSPVLSVSLLMLQLGILLVFASRRWSKTAPSATQTVTVLFTSNLIGVSCARTIHYQFYAWYAHSVPFLLHNTTLPLAAKLALQLALEVPYNVYPPTAASSLLLQATHFAILLALYALPTAPGGNAAKKSV